MTCSSCGAPLELEPRIRRMACSVCRREPALCVCRPLVSAVPEWVKRMQEHRGVAKVFSGRAA